MQLKISYSDSSRRIVNVAPDFFLKTEVRDRYKTTIVTPEMKSMDFALSTGNPHEIVLTNGAEVVYKEVLRHNKPVVERKETRKEWESFMRKDMVSMKEVKALRKESFTKKWNPRTEPMPWKIGIELFLNHVK